MQMMTLRRVSPSEINCVDDQFANRSFSIKLPCMTTSPILRTARSSRFTAYLACIAVLLMTFAPLVSRIQASSVDYAQSMCHVQEENAVQIQQPVDKKSPLQLDHCPYCFVHAGSFGLL